MSEGHVYILTNEAMPGLVKIGRTSGDPQVRASQLSTTGVPFPFEVEHAVFSPNAAELEANCHSVLADCRVNSAREFFLCETGKAIRQLDALNLEMVDEMVAEYLPNHCLTDSEMFIDPSVIMVLATYTDLHPFELADALHHLHPEDIQGAIKRWRDRRAGKRQPWLQAAPTRE